MTKIDELMDIVVAGDDLAAEDAAFLCQRLDSFAWHRALERAARQAEHNRREERATPAQSQPEPA